MTADLLTIVTDTARRLIGEGSLYLVDVEVKGAPGAPLVWVYVDAVSGGVDIDACAKLSRELVFHLNATEGVPEVFTLNVSSPGLDRPLKDPRQFTANIGRMASVKFRDAEGKIQTRKGRLTAADADHFTLTDDQGAEHRMPVSESELKIVPVFH